MGGPLIVVTGASANEGGYIALAAVNRELSVMGLSFAGTENCDPEVARKVNLSGIDLTSQGQRNIFLGHVHRFNPEGGIHLVACPDPLYPQPQASGLAPLFREFSARFGPRVKLTVVHTQEDAWKYLALEMFHARVELVHNPLNGSGRLKPSLLAGLFVLGFLKGNNPSGGSQLVNRYWQLREVC